MTTFLRVLNAAVDEKAQALKLAAQGNGSSFEVEPSAFAQVPGSPFAYWVSQHVRNAFVSNRSFVDKYEAWVGLQTNDDFRWLRLLWEGSPEVDSPTRLVPLAKGGKYSQYYADLSLGVRWGASGTWIKSWKLDQLRLGRITANNSKCWNESHYLRPGLTWPSRTDGLSVRVLPRSSIFGHKGPTAFSKGDSSDELLALCAIMNSSCFRYLVGLQLARTELAQSFEVGLIQQTPVPEVSAADARHLAHLAHRAWALQRCLDTVNETSNAFLVPSALRARIGACELAAAQADLASVQAEIDDHAFRLYGILGDERDVVEASAGCGGSAKSGGNASANEQGDEEGEDEDSEGGGKESESVVSWLVGVAFGRFDPRYVTGGRAVAAEPLPFDPVPARSPGMYPEGEVPAGRPDLLVDDEGHADDLAARARAVADRAHADVPENLRSWLAKEFFPLHVRMYSKSRRKAPIYWQLATPSASYSVWLYIHAFSKDTIFRVQNDYAAPKLAHEERRLEAMRREQREGATAAQRKELAAQETFVEELRAFLDEVKRVAPLWNPNLDDGVIINFAPLWRLVPQHKSWQKELKSTWDALCEGEYDWAHLAMHLWPERVVPKCAKDRSLAIAHGSEEVFWVEDAEGKWAARRKSTRSIDELVRERTSPAVKAALKSLLEAPVASGGSGRGRGGGRRKTASATEGEGR
jgi:hypothetical protein